MKDKDSTFKKITSMLQDEGFTVSNKDDQRPWGGFFVIDEVDAPKFVSHYFPEENMDELMITLLNIH